MQFTRLTRDFIFFPRDVLFFLYAIYYAQGSLYTSGSIISQASLAIFLLISIVYFVKTLLLKEKKCQFYYGWTFLLILNITGFIFSADFSTRGYIDMFKNILGCMLPFYPFYYFAKKDQLKPIHLILFSLAMMPIIILTYFTSRNEVLLASDYNNMVNNVSYMFVCLMPFVFLINRKKLISGALMAIILIFVIQGAKRGALIAGSIGLLMYFYYQMKTLERHNRISGFLFAIIVMLVLSVFAYRTFMSNEFILNRMTSMVEGDTSNRDLIYSSIFDKWYNNYNIGNFIYGFGFASSFEIAGTQAHSDWLELLSNFGLVGIGAYLFLFYTAAKCSLNKEWMLDKRVLMLTNTLIWFFITLVSMWYTDMRSCMQVILFGYLIGSKNTSL